MLQEYATILQRLIINPKKIRQKFPVNCTHCGIEFLAWQSRINRAKKVQNGRLFCSRKCCRDYHPKRKEKFAWCTNCHWVLKSELIMKPKGTKNIYRSSNFPKNRSMFTKGDYNEIGIETTSQSYRSYITKKDQYMCPHCKDNISCKKKT